MTTINAQTIINALQAAALAAPMEHDQFTMQWLPECMQYANHYPYGFDGDLEHAEIITIEDTEHGYSHDGKKAEKQAMAYGRYMVASACAEIRALLNVPNKIKVQTSARGYFVLQNTKAKLEAMAATVRSKSAAFGGGLVKTPRAPKSATTWPAGAVRMAREMVQDHDYAGALELAESKAGALFFFNGANRGGQVTAFMLLAPIDCAELPGLQSAQHEKGHYVVFDPASSARIGYMAAPKSRRAAIEDAMRYAADNGAEKMAAALERVRSEPQDTKAARGAWILERGIVASEDAAARIEEHQAQETEASEDKEASKIMEAAARDVAHLVANATAGAAIEQASEAAALGEIANTEQARDLVRVECEARELVTTCEAGAMGGNSSASAPSMGHAGTTGANAACMGQTINSKSGNWTAKFRVLPDGSPCMDFCKNPGSEHQDWQVCIFESMRERMQALQTMARNADTAANAATKQPEITKKNLIAAGFHPVVADGIARHGIAAYGPMAQAEILEKLKSPTPEQEPNQTATPEQPAGVYPAPATHSTQNPATSGTDYTDTRETSGGLHDTLQDLETKPAKLTPEQIIEAVQARGFHAVQAKGQRVVLSKKGNDYGLQYSNTTQAHKSAAKLAAAGIAADVRGWAVVITGLLDAPQTITRKVRAMMPKDAERFSDDAGRWECYLCTYGERFSVISYLADAFNPTEHYTYKTEEKARAAVAKFAIWAEEIAAERDKRKQQRRADMDKPHGLQVGDIVRSSWGYDQTNTDYYQITKLCGAHTVEVRKVAQMSENTSFMSGVCVPVPGQFVSEAMRRTVDRYGSVNILRATYGRASKIEPTIAGGVKCYTPAGWSSYA
jgi:hypothetical protein